MHADAAPATIAPRDWATQPALIDLRYKSTGLRGPRQALVPILCAGLE